MRSRIDTTQLNKRRRFFVLFGVLMMLVFIRYVLQVPLPWATLLLMVMAIGLLGDRDEIIAICVCCIPLYTSFQYIYGLGACMVLYIIRFRDDLRINTAIFPMLLILGWELLHCFDGYSSIMGGIRAMIPLLFCTFLMFCPREKLNYPFVIRVLATCVCIMCGIVLSKLLLEAGFDIRRAFADMRRLGFDSEDVDVVGADFNPNFLGYLCILASTGLIQMRMDGRGRRRELVMIGFMLTCGTLTLSRTYLVCLALMAGLFLLTQRKDIRKIMKACGQILAAGLGILVVLAIFFPAMLEEFFARFQVEDITSGRTTLVEIFNERIFSHPSIYLFGVGSQSLTAKMQGIFGMEMYLGTVVPHNAIQELLLCWGFPGLILMIWFICGMIATARRKDPGTTLINYIPLIVFLVKIQAGQLVTTPQNMLCLSVAYLSMCHPFGKAEGPKPV